MAFVYCVKQFAWIHSCIDINFLSGESEICSRSRRQGKGLSYPSENECKKSQLELFEILEEPEMIQNRQRILNNKNYRFPVLKSVWDQTAPLFQSPHVLKTVLLCMIQFFVFKTSNGFFIFFGEIMNKMAVLDSFTNQRMMMCDIYRMTPINDTDFEPNTQVSFTLRF